MKLAVMDIRALGTEAHKADLLSEVVLTEAATYEGLEVVGRSDIESMLGFQKQKQVLGCAEDSACLAEIGGALGVEYVLVGSLGKLGSLSRLDLKLVETRKARVRARVGESVEGSEEKLVAAVQRAVHKLLDPLAIAAAATATRGSPPHPDPLPRGEGERLERSTATSTPSVHPERSAAGAESKGAESKDIALSSSGLGRRGWGSIAGGAGLACVAAGVVAGVLARSAYDAEQRAASAGDLAAYTDSKQSAKGRALTADLLYAAGAVGLGTGAFLYFTGASAPVAISFGPITGGGVVAAIRGVF